MTQNKHVIGLLAVGFATLLAGEYYVLTAFDLHAALQAHDRLALVLLKGVFKAGLSVRVGFLFCYFMWLATLPKVAKTSSGSRSIIRGLFLALLIASGYGLMTLQKQSLNYVRIIYPFSAAGVILSGLFLAPFINLRLRQPFGVKNDRWKINNPYSFNFRTSDGWINVPNPFRGIFITGGAGSGKSFSLANPIIHQAVQKGYTGLIYDFKFPILASEVNKALVLSGRKDIAHYILNFTDPTRSHRLNPLKPENMPVMAYAEEYALAIIHNLLPESIRRKDFWIRSANAILTAVIWFLKKHHPRQCTIPHVVNTLLYPDYLHVLDMLKTDDECSDMVRSILSAVENDAGPQVAGVIGSLQIAIVRINSPEVGWVLSGDDFDLNLNDPTTPKLLTLGSDPTLADTFSPVISCIATVALKLMNQPGKRPSIVLLDEAPTLYIPRLEMIPATARSNKVATVYMAQDFSQMVAYYGKEVADVVMANLNNQFYGRVGSAATAKQVSELFGREEKETESYSTGQGQTLTGTSTSRSQSVSRQERWVVRPQDVINLPVGEFVGMTVESEQPYFWSQIKVKKLPERNYPIPPFASGIDVLENYRRIRAEVAAIIQLYERKNSRFPQTKQRL